MSRKCNWFVIGHIEVYDIQYIALASTSHQCNPDAGHFKGYTMLDKHDELWELSQFCLAVSKHLEAAVSFCHPSRSKLEASLRTFSAV